jgi:hypothetical protein
MKMIVSALLALTVLCVAAPASALDGKDLYEQDRTKF